jgi:hypothetical protein
MHLICARWCCCPAMFARWRCCPPALPGSMLSIQMHGALGVKHVGYVRRRFQNQQAFTDQILKALTGATS